jgi:hypothetical protein
MEEKTELWPENKMLWDDSALRQANDVTKPSKDRCELIGLVFGTLCRVHGQTLTP